MITYFSTFTIIIESEIGEVWSDTSCESDSPSDVDEDAPTDMSIENSQDSETADTSKFCELLKEWFVAFFLPLQAQCHVPD